MSRQIEFPEMQTHKKSFEQGLILFSLGCIAFAILMIVIVSGGDWANF